MGKFSEFYQARDIITDILAKDFVGPVSASEVLNEFPVNYYIMGKLYPQGDATAELDMARNPFLENGIETYDGSVSLSGQKNPSSIGLTCTLLPGVSKISVTGSYAFYEPILPPAKTGADTGNDHVKGSDYLWKRMSAQQFTVPVEFRDSHPVHEAELPQKMKIRVYTNRLFPDTGERVITVVLINENHAVAGLADVSKGTAFQASIAVEADHDEPVFTSVERKINLTTDPELLELDMLYEGVHCYAQGHGCSAEWDLENESPKWVRTAFLPSFNLKQMKPAAMDLRVFNMFRLHSEPADTIISELWNFTDCYEKWIDGLRKLAADMSESRRTSAMTNIGKCEYALATIRRTITALDKDRHENGVVYRAFQLANEAMFMQRVQSLRRRNLPVHHEEINWYPFQLAFILQEMISFIDPEGEERKRVDLLWFPTGGGKTEAYLGIAAFVVFLRRLRNPGDDGVSIIMRYTLRLLTLQQFERASMLIFACEILRREHKLGGSEISIGLWVGGKLTPNKLEAARASINKQKMGGLPASGDENPCQIKVCPWCGAPLNPDNYSADTIKKRMYIQCHNKECYFQASKDGLPVHIIDDAIYQHLPTFLIATVDKFAQIPLSDKPAALFGITRGKNPPELIIQDELHLISGPLGTMTGIYEAAVSKLCEHNGIPAKVIASTATIRNAENQIRALYGREFTQFPPQGLSTKDSFFAVESTEEERPARKYVGIMGVGTTATTTLIRVNAALLFATRYLDLCRLPADVVDGFWTITGYFNSLRELGGASTQILDDVQRRFGYLAKTKFAGLYPGVNPDKAYDNNVELTSRMSNEEITKVIQIGLQRKHPSPDAYDFVLASNMISVGVDVSRLGTMVVAGQPKTNAEYIQATSRVGRDNPGLVVTVYNQSRSRDRSHYEQFLKYHSALYRYVEATSLTPFSDRARDRGLHALFVALCRYLCSDLLHDGDAIHFRADDPKVEKIREMIRNYVAIVDAPELDAVEKELDEICEQWEQQAIGSLSYRWGDKNLLKKDTENDCFRTMNSLRNVDGQSGIYLLGRT